MPFKKACLVFILLGINACSNQRFVNNTHENQWSFDGKISIKTQEKTHNANIIWQHNAPNYTITLFGPFGQGKVKITKNKNTLTLEQAQQIIQAETADELLLKATGWSLPINTMPYWIHSQASPNSSAHITRNEDHQILAIEQEGWTIKYLKRDANTKPQKIKLTRDTLSILLVIKQWH